MCCKPQVFKLHFSKLLALCIILNRPAMIILNFQIDALPGSPSQLALVCTLLPPGVHRLNVDGHKLVAAVMLLQISKQMILKIYCY